jgi:hypothetical protein
LFFTGVKQLSQNVDDDDRGLDFERRKIDNDKTLSKRHSNKGGQPKNQTKVTYSMEDSIFQHKMFLSQCNMKTKLNFIEKLSIWLRVYYSL